MLLNDIPVFKLSAGDLFQDSKGEIYELMELTRIDTNLYNIAFKIIRSDKKQQGAIKSYYNFELQDFKLISKGVKNDYIKPSKILSARYAVAHPPNKKFSQSSLL